MAESHLVGAKYGGLTVKKVLVLSVLAGAGFLIGQWVARSALSAATQGTADTAWAQTEQTEKLVMPRPELTPREVVELQVSSLRAFRDNPKAIRQCFVLASPENRAVTGPIERFSLMVKSPAYMPLVSQQNALVGRGTEREDRAVVLVTVLDEGRQPNVFWFLLSKQASGEYAGCWMTDAVTNNTQSDAPPADDQKPTA